MNDCGRLNNVHQDATNPELYRCKRPTECVKHIMGEQKKRMATKKKKKSLFKRERDKAKAVVKAKIRKKKSKKGCSQKEIDKAFDEYGKLIDEYHEYKFVSELESVSCQPQSLYLPEFEKDFTNEELCPYLKLKER